MEDVDETAGVPVQFESDDDDDRMAYELREDKNDDDDQDDVGVEAIYGGTLRTADNEARMEEEGENAGEGGNGGSNFENSEFFLSTSKVEIKG